MQNGALADYLRPNSRIPPLDHSKGAAVHGLGPPPSYARLHAQDQVTREVYPALGDENYVWLPSVLLVYVADLETLPTFENHESRNHYRELYIALQAVIAGSIPSSSA
ncbi:hypothetical protein Cob_v004076 [Colletotrichum orbiculare MAFF 240422]|uniref:Uncharacterized protein n=1 Tax=Colletotrichum orbiculare (strain 104-T / ATCC 96160 / CBS 514.97 / LARS 414 / MAFF 240422) TaxID=1213857 RepID=A0A484FZ05_COLOR|nr:hypothetical protein Cob_v004076 [Colletotrichum orbiculare MAFF 240422]